LKQVKADLTSYGPICVERFTGAAIELAHSAPLSRPIEAAHSNG
jgi:hypothetical protein